ncbi:MAG: hypothetical protein JWN17_939 [Frankiales bacterium]|nr:hypothetical protein [Frankiales bacterium]
MSGVRISHAPDGVTTWYALYRPARPEWSTTPRAAERVALHQHGQWLDHLTRTGVCVAAGVLVDDGTEFAVLDGLERREARSLCERDPWIAEGHATVELVPMRLSHERGSAPA